MSTGRRGGGPTKSHLPLKKKHGRVNAKVINIYQGPARGPPLSCARIHRKKPAPASRAATRVRSRAPRGIPPLARPIRKRRPVQLGRTRVPSPRTNARAFHAPPSLSSLLSLTSSSLCKFLCLRDEAQTLVACERWSPPPSNRIPAPLRSWGLRPLHARAAIAAVAGSSGGRVPPRGTGGSVTGEARSAWRDRQRCLLLSFVLEGGPDWLRLAFPARAPPEAVDRSVCGSVRVNAVELCLCPSRGAVVGFLFVLCVFCWLR
ncbi:hypothetical protein NL676_020468 [Syzygium grande]|nr:hypothetical protein NL676_020468 [Syzygium grande]